LAFLLILLGGEDVFWTFILRFGLFLFSMDLRYYNMKSMNNNT